MTVIFQPVIVTAAAPTVVLTHSRRVNLASPASYTADFGDYSSARAMIVGVYGDPTSLSVGGVTATKIFDNGSNMQYWRATGVTGTSGTVTMSGFSIVPYAFVWAAYFLLSTTPTDTASQVDGSNVITTSTTIAVSSNGIAVGMAAASTSGLTSETWSGLTESAVLTNSTTRASSAEDSGLAATASLSISVTWNVASAGNLTAVSFR